MHSAMPRYGALRFPPCRFTFIIIIIHSCITATVLLLLLWWWWLLLLLVSWYPENQAGPCWKHKPLRQVLEQEKGRDRPDFHSGRRHPHGAALDGWHVNHPVSGSASHSGCGSCPLFLLTWLFLDLACRVQVIGAPPTHFGPRKQCIYMRTRAWLHQRDNSTRNHEKACTSYAGCQWSPKS